MQLLLKVSSGTVDQAKQLIDKILKQCNKPLMDDHVSYYEFLRIDMHILNAMCSVWVFC